MNDLLWPGIRVITYLFLIWWILKQRRQIRLGDKILENMVQMWANAEKAAQHWHESYDALDQGFDEMQESYEMDLLTMKETNEGLHLGHKMQQDTIGDLEASHLMLLAEIERYKNILEWHHIADVPPPVDPEQEPLFSE